MMTNNSKTYENRFNLIFEELERLKTEGKDSGTFDFKELDEIAELRKIVSEVETEHPRFMTST